MLPRIFVCLALALVSAPALAEYDSWGSDDWDSSDAEYDPADGPMVRRQLNEVGQHLNTGLAALESDNWVTAQYECARADDIASETDYSGESAFVDGREIARKCIADAAYGKGNADIACEWWAKVGYDSFVWEDPVAICNEQ